LASAPAETKIVPVGKFAALKPGGRAAVFADVDAEAAPVEEPSAHKVTLLLKGQNPQAM